MSDTQLSGLSKIIGNAAILVGGFFLFVGAAIGVAIVFCAAILVVLLRKLRPGRPALTVGGYLP